MSLAYHSTEYLENQIKAKDAETASLRAQNELTHVAYVGENNRLMAEREALRAELASRQIDVETFSEGNRQLRVDLATAKARIEHMSKVLVDAEELLGVEETGELILRPIERLKAELAAAKRELNDAEEARNDAETRLLASLTAGQDAEEIARLKGLVDRLVDVIAGSRSGYVAGSQYDCEWDQAKNSALAEVRAALACHPHPARNRPLPETRCDCCDNGLDDAWEFCPFCGQQHPDAAGALACRPQGEKS